MRLLSCLDRIEGNLDAATGAILETDRRAEPRRQLTVNLALGRAGSNRSPGDQVGDILGADGVEKLGA